MAKPRSGRPIIRRDVALQRLWWIWNSMHRRCSNTGTKQYSDYGGRGIAVCERWNDFWKFHDDMMPRPSGKSMMDRIDNNLGYSPENCRWVYHAQSNANRRCCVIVDGVTLKEYMRSTCQLNRYRMVLKRIDKGMAVMQAIAQPPRLWSGREQAR